MLLLVVLLTLALAVIMAFRNRSWRRIFIALCCITAMALAALWVYDLHRRPYLVASWLNLEHPPESLSVLDCQDAWLLTDVDSNCLISIDPQQFSELLSGYDFFHQSAQSSEVSLATGTRIFEVADMYSVTPADFLHGGAVTVYANSARNQAIVNLYIE